MKSETYKRIPNLLRKYRRISGFTQREVAMLLGLKNRSRISWWESGREIPSAMNVFRLSVAYRVLADALFIDHIHVFRKEIHERERKLFPNLKSSAIRNNYA